MTKILWDQPGEKIYEAAVDRGVLYTKSGEAVPWNGLISINEKTAGWEANPVYFDGIKIGDSVALGDYAATISAYTYPEEFLDALGVAPIGNGMYVDNQTPNRFGLSYRTKVGDDINGTDLGYKIHVLYNLIAAPSQKNNQTGDLAPIEFQWDVTTIPEEVHGYRATSHVIFDTRYMEAMMIQDIETALYGDGFNQPGLPDLATLVGFAGNWAVIRITEFSDGTWTAEGPANLITYLDGTTFQITQANAIFIDANTYMISNTVH